MNIGLILLWILVLVFTLIFVYVSAISMSSWRSSVSSVNDLENSVCEVPFDELPSVSDLPCCYIGDTITASRYLESLDMVVNPVASSYHSVCAEYCTSGISSDGKTCKGGIGQSDFNKCILISRPRNCTGPSMPVASDGIVYYYPQAAGITSCQDRRACV